MSPAWAEIFSSAGVQRVRRARRMSSKYMRYWPSFGCSAIYRSMVGADRQDLGPDPRRCGLQVGVGLEGLLLHLHRAADARVFVVALRTVDIDAIGLHAELFGFVDQCDEVRRRLAELALPLRHVRNRCVELLLGRSPRGVVLEEPVQIPFVAIGHLAAFSRTGERRQHQGGRQHHGG